MFPNSTSTTPTPLSPTSPAPPRLHNPKVPDDKPDISIPQARRIAVDTTGAQIVQEESVAVSLETHNAVPSGKT